MENYNLNASNKDRLKPNAPYENGKKNSYKKYVEMIEFMRKNGADGGTGYFAPLTWCRNFIDDAAIREVIDAGSIDVLSRRITSLKERVNENMKAKESIGEENYEEMDAIVEEIKNISEQLLQGKKH
jgi:hypothetical protein